MANKQTQTDYAKPPKYLPDEEKLRRQHIGLGLMAMYRGYGWLQPTGDEWRLEVSTWYAALAFIPTAELADAFTNALAQFDAPKPLTFDYVKRVYNGIPGQGYRLVGDPSHRAYVPTPAPVLALPPGPPLSEAEQIARADQKAAELTANIKDPQLRAVFSRLARHTCLDKELRTKAPDQKPAPATEAAKSNETVSGREYLAGLKASNALPDWIKEDLAKSKGNKQHAQSSNNEETNNEPAEPSTRNPRPKTSRREGGRPNRSPAAGRGNAGKTPARFDAAADS